MLQNPCKTFGFKKNMVYKIPPGGGGGKPYPASGLNPPFSIFSSPEPKAQGELIGWDSSGRPSVRLSVRLPVHTFEHEYL